MEQRGPPLRTSDRFLNADPLLIATAGDKYTHTEANRIDEFCLKINLINSRSAHLWPTRILSEQNTLFEEQNE